MSFGPWSDQDKVFLNVPQIGVFAAYILVFPLEKSLIVSSSLPELIPLTPIYGVPPFGPEFQVDPVQLLVIAFLRSVPLHVSMVCVVGPVICLDPWS